jgi:thiol-disulfide isomerase/thioredoxin
MPYFTRRLWIAVAAAGYATAAFSATLSPHVGDPAPALVAPTPDGRSIDLLTLRGQVVVLNVWASWCPPCRAEMPVLSHLQEEHARDGLVVLALSADRHRDRGDAIAALKGLTLTAAFMDGAKPNGYANPEALPITYVIDREGIIRAIFPPGGGAIDARALEAAIAPWLTAANPTP